MKLNSDESSIFMVSYNTPLFIKLSTSDGSIEASNQLSLSENCNSLGKNLTM